MSEIVVITDTSVLINFLVLDRTELLARLPNHRFVVTDHVRAEVIQTGLGKPCSNRNESIANTSPRSLIRCQIC